MESEEVRQARLDMLQKIQSGEFYVCAGCGRPYKLNPHLHANVCEACLKKIKPPRLSFPASIEVKGKQVKGQLKGR